MDSIWRSWSSVPALWWALAMVVLVVLALLTVRVWLSARRLDRSLEAIEMIEASLTGLAARTNGHEREPAREYSPGEETRLSLTRWLRSGQGLLTVLEGTVTDHERVRAEAEMYRAEAERLRSEVERLRMENERFLHERGEITQNLSRIVNDVLLPPRR